MGHEGEDGSCVPSLFHLTADTLSTHLRLFSKQSISDLPGTIVSSLVEFLSAEHLEEFDDVFQEKGIDTTRAWREHILKRWSQTYHFRPPVFKSHVTQSPKHQYFQKHFHESLRALLHYSSYDPSTPLREKLREQRCFELRSMNRALLKVDVNRYAKYAQSFVTSSANCNDIKALKKMMEALKKSTKVLEVYLHACVYRSAIITGNFIRFLRELKEEGCLEELHLHISNFDIREIFVEIIKECVKGGTARTDIKSTLKDNLSCLLGFKTVSDPNVVNVCSLEEGYGQTEKDLFDEALSTLPSRQPEKEFEKLLAATEKQSCSMEEEDMAQAGTSSETKESPQGKQLRGLAVYDLHCRAETARDLAHLLIGWTQLEKLSIHHFGGAGSAHHSVVEECDPDFALLCQVILHKVRRHQLTHLILLEQAVEREPLLAVVRFYTSLVQILNTEYRVSANQQRPLQFLRLPMICAMDEVEMFSGRILNNPVHAVEHLKVEIDPPYPQNREVCARHIPAFLSGFLRFDSALTCLTIKDSSAYMYRFSDDDVIRICDAITECQRIEELELDFNLTSSTSVETLVDMIGRQRTLRKISILRIGLDWEEEKVKGVHEKLIEAVRNHQQLSHLTMKGPLGRALYGRFLVDFMISLFNTIPAPSLKHLDISETGTTTDDLFTVMAALRSSPCVRRGPVLEGLRVRNTVKCPDTTITMLPNLRRELKRLAHIVELSFEDHFGFQAELLAQV